jgi:hypothetical protein
MQEGHSCSLPELNIHLLSTRVLLVLEPSNQNWQFRTLGSPSSWPIIPFELDLHHQLSWVFPSLQMADTTCAMAQVDVSEL